jgi:predicted  nucleic acid-binding Zn-ribbon protein
MRTKLILLLALSLLGLNCGRNDAKGAETRIVSEIDRMTEESRNRMNTSEIRHSLSRMNELRPSFPENRDEIDKESKAIRSLYSQLIEDEVNISSKWEELLALPLAPGYRKCVELQIRSSTSLTDKLRLSAEEIDLLLDRTIVDKESLETALKPLRTRREAVEAQDRQIDTEIDSSCRRGSF